MTENNSVFDQDRVDSIEETNSEMYRGSNQYNPSPISDFREQYEDREEITEDEEQEWVLSGRITRINEINGLFFFDIDDRSATVQVMCTEDDTANPEDLSNINSGDRVVFTGIPSFSNTGELSLFASEFSISGKALNYVADQRNQLNEKNQITHRTGALASNDDLFTAIQTRFQIQQAIRDHLTQQGFMEFDTPILQNQAGGAEATPFQTRLESLDMDVFLRISPELYLKRLITAGYQSVFEIGRCFRNEDIDTTHNPEFTMLELYQEYADYEDMMDLVETLFQTIAQELTGTTTVEYDGVDINLANWDRITFEEAIEQELDIQSVAELDRVDIQNYLLDYTEENLEEMSRDELLFELFEERVEDELEGPVFVTEYPTVSTPLCQTVEGDESRLQRFEAFICGMEVGNAYTELTDPIEQRDRLLDQANGDEESVNMEFIEAISYGMPPTAGLGLGIDRLAMLFTDSQSIKSVLPFPMSAERI